MSHDDTDIEETKDLARRAAISRILRRRHRRIKPRANSNTAETSWAEYGPVTLTPSQSDQSFWSYAGYALLVTLAFGFPMLMIYAAGSGDKEVALFRWNGLSGILTILLYIIMITGAASIAIALVAAFWRIIASNLRR